MMETKVLQNKTPFGSSLGTPTTVNLEHLKVSTQLRGLQWRDKHVTDGVQMLVINCTANPHVHYILKRRMQPIFDCLKMASKAKRN